MAKRSKKISSVPFLPLMSVQLAMDSWETIARRTMMIAEGTCSPSEYQRMVTEKTNAIVNSMLALGSGNVAAILRPWHAAAQDNTRRLRAKR